MNKPSHKVYPRASTCTIETPADLKSLAEIKINQSAHMNDVIESDKLHDEGWALRGASEDWKKAQDASLHFKQQALALNLQVNRAHSAIKEEREAYRDLQKEAVRLAEELEKERRWGKKWLIVDCVVYVCFVTLLCVVMSQHL